MLRKRKLDILGLSEKNWKRHGEKNIRERKNIIIITIYWNGNEKIGKSRDLQSLDIQNLRSN